MFIRRIFVVFIVFVSLNSSAQNKKPRAHLAQASISSICKVTDLPPDQPDTIFHYRSEPDEPGEKDSKFIFHKRRLPNSSWNNYFEVTNYSGLNKTNAGNFQIGTQAKYGIYTLGTPPDNTMAISNDGNIVASINTRIGFYDSSANSIKTQINTATFLNDPTITQSDLFDPRIIYDPKADRFIYVVLSGSTNTTTKVVIGFSQSKDPTGLWKFYTLPGNFDGSQSWFDYPNIAITDNELIITGNLFYSPANTFNQAVILQINKVDGYNGAVTLQYKFWDNIFDALGQNAFTVVPAVNGTMQKYGPNFYLVCISASATSVLSLFEITDAWNIASQLTLKAVNVDLYSTPPLDAQQKGTSKRLDVKKNRIRSVYIANGILHYAYITPTNTFGTVPAIAYGRYDLATSSVKQLYIGQAGFNFAFPAIMHFSNIDTKNITALTYLASNNTIYPEIRALIIDENMIASSSVTVKAGENFINYGITGSERWGDYTGTARKYNSVKPEVWLFGCYGETNNKWGNYIAQITADPDIIPPVLYADSFYITPNPTLRYLDVNIIAGDTADYGVKIYSSKGQLLYQSTTTIPPGSHVKTIDLAGYSPEEYIIRVSRNDVDYKPSKFILLAR